MYVGYASDNSKEILLTYDFNRTDVILGSLDTEWDDYGSEKLRYVSDCEIQNSGRTYRSYKFVHFIGDEIDDFYKYDAECVEGIGMPKSVLFGHNIFFLPFANHEFTALQPMLLRYVTDKDNNIIFEQEGGTKLWTEVSGVGNVSADRMADGEPQWYNLQGVLVDRPTVPGVYVKKSGNSAQKVLLR